MEPYEVRGDQDLMPYVNRAEPEMQAEVRVTVDGVTEVYKVDPVLAFKVDRGFKCEPNFQMPGGVCNTPNGMDHLHIYGHFTEKED